MALVHLSDGDQDGPTPELLCDDPLNTLGQHAAWLAECAALGFESLNLHNVGTNQRAFLDAFGEHVFPSLRTAGA